jgi:CBS domain containing-hemolysin-like protein
MTTALIIIAAVFCALLPLVTFVQLLYLESLRLRPHERPALEYFKDTVQRRIGIDSEHGAVTFSLVKHSILVTLGVIFLLLSAGLRSGNVAGAAVEGCITAWLVMLASTYVLPHILYRRSSGRWLGPLAPLLWLIAMSARPLVGVFAFLHSVTELAERSEAGEEEPGPSENIEALISAGAEEGLIEESDRELIQSVVEFGDKTVREVMTPRPNIVAIEASQSLESLRELVINEQYSRVPVFEGSIDKIVGFVHVRDMFELDEDERKLRTVRELMRPIRFVPETKRVNDLLREMQQDRAHISIVVDEYGNTAGLATMEDLVEEVFGEIRDEHEPGLDISQDTNGNYIVSGNFGLDRLEDLMHVHLGEEPESTTVGGLVMEWLGRVPQPGESVERDGIRIEVIASNELRVEQVRLSRAKKVEHA